MAKFNAKIIVTLLLIAGSIAYLFNNYIHWKDINTAEMPKVELSAKNSFNQTIKIATDNNLPPFSFLDKDNKLSGFYIELTNELANRLDYNVEYSSYSWSQAEEKLKSGEIDMIIGYINVFSDQFKENKNFSAPLSSDHFSIFATTPINSLKELHNKKVALRKIYNPNEIFQDSMANISVVPFDSHKEALMAAHSGQTDAVICPSEIGNFLSIKENLNLKESLKLLDFFSCYIVSHNNIELLPAINTVIEGAISDGTRSILENKWSKPVIIEKSFLQFMDESKRIVGIIIVLFLFFVVALFTSKEKEKTVVTTQRKPVSVPQKPDKKNTETDDLLLSRISRDFRTPINGIIGLTKIARMNMEHPEKIEEYLKKIDASSQRLLTVFTDFLNLNQIKSGKVRLYSAPISLIDVIKDCESFVVNIQDSAQLNFQCDYSKLKHKAVIGDRVHLRQLLINILDNAVKFTPAGGTVNFKISDPESTEKAAKVIFEIQDSGKGMSPDFLKSLFGEFTQEKTTFDSERTGIGLGLFIAKAYADIMNATINVRSEVGKGTKFTITITFLPCNKPVIEQDGDLHSLKNKHVLVVEDNDINMEIAEEFLTEEGIITTPAENGEEAVNIFASSPDFYFQAILMDIMMPIMDGYEATRTIRAMQREDAKSIPIVAMTANALSEDHHKSLAIGMDAHLIKPIEKNLLISTLSSLISMKEK